MIQQNLFSFNYEITKEKLTSKSGLPLIAGFYEALGFSELADKYLPRPLSGRGV